MGGSVQNLDGLRLELRRDAAELKQDLQNLLLQLNKRNRDVRIAKVTGTVTSAVGGILGIVGAALSLTVVLAPVGIPLALTGAGIGTAGSVTSGGADVSGCIMDGKAIAAMDRRLAALKLKLESFARELKTVEEKEQELNERERATLSRCQKIRKFFAEDCVTLTRVAGSTCKSAVSLGVKIGTTVAKRGVIRAGILSADEISQTGTSVAKVATTTAGKVFLGLGLGFSIVGLAVDVGVMGYNAHHLRKNTDHQKADALRAVIADLEELERELL